jgi:pimeloyl-ACP methyl ester carboxylesterase
MKDKVILGIDPGTNIMGYGVLQVIDGKAQMVSMGVIDLRKFEDGYRYRKIITQYFRFPSEEFSETNTAGFEPYRTRSFVNAEGERAVIPPCPVKIWQGADDKTVDPVLSREYYDSIRRAGCYAELHVLDGVAHKVVDTMKKELAIWFNRFI